MPILSDEAKAIYGEMNPWLEPLYSIREAAHHLRVAGDRVEALFYAPGADKPAVSFYSLAGMHELFYGFYESHKVARAKGSRFPIRFYPFVGEGVDRLSIVIDPLVCGGRPCVGGVPTSVIAGRATAGDSVSTLMADYDFAEAQIIDAITFERALLK